MKDQSDALRAGRDAISAIKLSQRLTAKIDAWAEARHMARSEAIRQLLEIGLSASPHPQTPQQHRTVGEDATEIEQRAAAQIGEMLDPLLPKDERIRRTRRLTEGPPEFAKRRIDLPKHEE